MRRRNVDAERNGGVLVLIDKIFEAFPNKPDQDTDVGVIENCDLYELNYSAQTVGYDYPHVQQLFQFISDQDMCVIIIAYGSAMDYRIDEKNYMDNCTDKLDELNALTSEHDLLDIQITIKKRLANGVLSVYDFAVFSGWLFHKSPREFLSCCGTLKGETGDNVLFRCFEEDVYLRAGFLNFDSCKTEIEQSYVRPSFQDIREVCGIVSDPPLRFIPDDFHITGINKNIPEQYTDYFNRIEQMLSMAYIVNQAYVYDHTIRIVLKGYRVIDEEIDILQMGYNSNLYRIFNWVYSTTSFTEKILLARNLISIGCKWKSILEVDEAVLPAIQSNYNLYLQGNVKDYLSLKKEVVETIQTFCNKVSDAIHSYTGSLKTNYIAIFGYITTVLLTKGIQKDTDQIFTGEIVTLSSVILVGSLLVCILSLFELKRKYSYFDQMIGSLRAQYSDILEEKVLEEMIDRNNLLCTARDNYNKSLWWITVIWIVSILGMFLLLDKVSGNVQLLFCINIFKQANG